MSMVPALKQVSPIPIPDPLVRRLGHTFSARGRQLYLVGGGVRDLLAGRQVVDLDFATDALPDETKELVRQAGADHVYAVGERFGTIAALFGTRTVEITTYRGEKYEPGLRKPEVQFGRTLMEDLSRRDFTINAMAIGALTGELVDPFGGQKDLRMGVVRAVGVPEERFAEDPLRLMRAVRFAAQLGFRIDPHTAEAIRRTASSLQHISRERIAQEMNKILLSPAPDRGLRLLVDLSLMQYIIPEVMEMRGMRQESVHYKDVLEHTLMVVRRVPPQLELRWAALLHDIAKPRTFSILDSEVHFYGHERLGEQMARRILLGLRYDRHTVDVVSKLVGMHLRANSYEDDWTDGAVRRFMREAGDQLENLLALSRADVTSRRPEKVRAALRRVARLESRCAALRAQEDVAKLSSPLDGNELMAMFGRGPGPWIRVIKDRLLAMVLDGTLAQDDKETASKIAREIMAEMEGGET